MAYLRNSIGEFKFISLEGEVDAPAQSVMVDSRAGVDGLEFTFLGKKSQPFSLVSLVDADSITDANLLVLDYKQLIAEDVVDITKNGVSLMTYRAKVLGVTPLDIRACAVAVGNKISNQARALLQCRWDLIAVPNP